jgi:hypothetical protein
MTPNTATASRPGLREKALLIAEASSANTDIKPFTEAC